MIYLGIDPAAGFKPNALAIYVPETDELFLLDIAQPKARGANAAHPKLGNVFLGLRSKYPGVPMMLGVETQFTYQDSPPKDPRDIGKWKRMRANQAGQAHILSRITGGYEVIAEQYGCPVVNVPPGRGKFALAEHGHATAYQMEQAVRRLYHVELVNSDRAHACGVALATQRQHLMERKRVKRRDRTPRPAEDS